MVSHADLMKIESLYPEGCSDVFQSTGGVIQMELFNQCRRRGARILLRSLLGLAPLGC